MDSKLRQIPTESPPLIGRTDTWFPRPHRSQQLWKSESTILGRGFGYFSFSWGVCCPHFSWGVNLLSSQALRAGDSAVLALLQADDDTVLRTLSMPPPPKNDRSIDAFAPFQREAPENCPLPLQINIRNDPYFPRAEVWLVFFCGRIAAEVYCTVRYCIVLYC